MDATEGGELGRDSCSSVISRVGGGKSQCLFCKLSRESTYDMYLE